MIAARIHKVDYMEHTQQATQVVLGLDIAKDKVDCALLRLGQVKSKVIANSPEGFAALGAWLHKHDVQEAACLLRSHRHVLGGDCNASV